MDADQTVVLALTMVIFIMHFRSQDTAIKEDVYKRDLDTDLDRRGQALFGYMLLNYSIFERIYLLYTRKWIDEDTWSQWHTCMKSMAKHPMFQEVHKRSQGTFDRAFQDLVEKAAQP